MCQLRDKGLLSDSNPSSGGEEEEEEEEEGVVRYRERVKGDLGVFLDVSTPRQRPSQ